MKATLGSGSSTARAGARTSVARRARGARGWGSAIFFAAATVALVASHGQARAEDSAAAKAKAKAKVEEGAKLMDAGDYAQALSDFEDAYKLVGNPKILFNVGLANVGLARYPDAIRAFEAFMAKAKNASSTTMTDAQKQIDNLRPKVAAVEVAAEPGLEIIIDGRSQGTTPLTVRVYVEPGQHRLLAQKTEGATPSVQTFNVRGGERQTIRVTMPEAIAVGAGAGAATVVAVDTLTKPKAGEGASNLLQRGPADVAEDRPVYKKAWFWGLIGGGVVGGAVAVFFLANKKATYPDASLGTVSGN